MAIHSRILAWRIPWTEEPGGLQSMGSLRVEHDGVIEHKDTPKQERTKSQGSLGRQDAERAEMELTRALLIIY